MPQHPCGCWPGLAEDTTLPADSSLAEDPRAAGDRQMAPVALAFVNQLVTAGSHPVLPFLLLAPRNTGIKPPRWQGWASCPLLAAAPFLKMPSKGESLAASSVPSAAKAGWAVITRTCHLWWGVATGLLPWALSSCEGAQLLLLGLVEPPHSCFSHTFLFRCPWVQTGGKKQPDKVKKTCFAVPSGLLRVVCSA